jgi:hypothetical protein
LRLIISQARAHIQAAAVEKDAVGGEGAEAAGGVLDGFEATALVMGYAKQASNPRR